MNITTPATKRQRIDPHALDDETLPARGQSVLGKRHRVQDNNYFYDNQSTQAVMRRDPNSNQNDSKDNDISMDGGGMGMGMGNNSNNNNNNNNNSNTGLFGSNFGGFNNNNNNNNGMNQPSGFMNNNNNNNNNSGFGGFGGFGNNNNNNNGSGGLWQNPPIKFTRGEWIDVKVTDTDDGESQWMCGVMTKDLDDKVQIHIPRQGTKILDKTSQDLAPVGTHTEGFN